MRPDKPLESGGLLVYRHPAVVRITHWLNLLSLVVLLLSGLQILCSHPAFYWGETARFAEPFAAIVSEIGNDGEPRGRLIAPGVDLDTTGLLGASKSGGAITARAIPQWLTLPGELDLGAGRRWHFFFAWLFVLNGAVYLATGLISRRLQRDLVPTREELAHVGQAVADHARLRFPHGEEARRYNVLQKLTYLPVVFGLLPLMLLTGLAMSPAIDARLHLAMILGGRQTARTLHFLSASGLVVFVILHVVMVVLAGPVNELRSMITGWFVIKPDEETAP